MTSVLRNLARAHSPLFVHNAGKHFILSISKRPEAIPLGRIPANEDLARQYTEEIDKFEPKRVIARPDSFEKDERFLPIARKVLKQHIHTCPVFASIATGVTDTRYFHIYDLRNPPPPNRVPDVDEILGTVEVEGGKIKPQSFDANPMYRLVTPYGAMTVSDEIAAKIARAVEDT